MLLKIRNQARMDVYSHWLYSAMRKEKIRKRKQNRKEKEEGRKDGERKNPDWREASVTAFIDRYHDPLDRKS